MRKLFFLVVVSLTVLEANPCTTLAKPGKFVAFQGRWIDHIGILKVHGDGDGWVNYRLYQDCSGYAPPCDKTIGHLGYDGGFLLFQLKSFRAARATALVMYSSFPKQVGTRFTLHRRTDGAMEIPAFLILPPRGFKNVVVFCKPTQSLPQCGA